MNSSPNDNALHQNCDQTLSAVIVRATASLHNLAPVTLRKVHGMPLTDREIVEALQRTPPFTEIASGELLAFVGCAVARTWKHRRVIVAEGDPWHGLLFVVTGTVRVTIDRLCVEILRGPCLPALSSALFATASSPVSVSALHGCETVFLNRDAGRELLDASSDARAQLVALLAAEADGRLERLSHLVDGSVEQRTIAVLDYLADRYGDPLDEGRYVAIPLRRTDIAMMARASTETTSRTLAKFQRNGWLRTNKAGLWWSGAVPEARRVRPRSERPLG